MRTHICDFSKIPKSGKKHQRHRCAWMGLTYFSKYRKTEGARRQSCQQLKVMTPNIDGKVTNVEKSAKFHHSHKRFHRVRFEATAWTSEILPFLITAIKWREVSSIPSFRTWATHPQFGLLWAPNKENLRVTVTLFGRMASVVTEHNFTAEISPVWLTLAFHLLKCDLMSSIYFHFRSEANWFSSRFFKKEKLVCNTTRCHSGFGPPYQTFLLSIVRIIFGD